MISNSDIENRKRSINSNSGNIQIKKRLQKRQILRLLYLNGSMSAVAIGQAINASIPTVVKLIEELIASGLIQKSGLGKSGGGRRPQLYELISDARYILTIVVGRDRTRIALLNLRNAIVAEIACKTSSLDNAARAMNQIHRQAIQLMRDNAVEHERILGVGLGIPGLVDSERGIGYTTFNFGDVPAKERFENLFKLPVLIENDARMLAVGEWKFGSAKGNDNVICVNIGQGIGLGMILNGKIYRGVAGFSGEFGHIQIERDGRLCHCGKRGCLETVASATVLAEEAWNAVRQGAQTKLNEMMNGNIENIDAQLIIKAAHEGDQFSINLLAGIGENIGFGLATIIHLMNPGVIVLAGQLAEAGKYLKDPVELSLNRYCIESIRQKTAIVVSALHAEAGIYGAAALVMEHVFSGENRMIDSFIFRKMEI